MHIKGTLLGTPNREPQEYSRNIIGMYLPGSLCSIIFLLYSWGSLFGVPNRVPLHIVGEGGLAQPDTHLTIGIFNTSGVPRWCKIGFRV